MDVNSLLNRTNDGVLAGEAYSSLVRIQDFQVSDLVQKDKLGHFSFENAVAPATDLVNFYKQLSDEVVTYLPDGELLLIKERADATFSVFSDILNFDPNVGDNTSRRDQLVESLRSNYQNVFTALHPLLAYSVARTVDFKRLEEQGRAAVQSIRDSSANLMQEIQRQKVAVEDILDEVRTAAAERGVSQEGYYFSIEAEKHAKAAFRWKIATFLMTGFVVAVAAGMLFLPKLYPELSPTNTFEAIQLLSSKLVVIFVLCYLLSIFAKNFLSNRHNEVVNRHRQCALSTYQSLVNAGGTSQARDAILNHAAASVYQLHDTGFIKAIEGGGPSSTSIIGMLPKSMPSSAG